MLKMNGVVLVAHCSATKLRNLPGQQREKIQWPWRIPQVEPVELQEKGRTTKRIALACRYAARLLVTCVHRLFSYYPFYIYLPPSLHLSPPNAVVRAHMRDEGNGCCTNLGGKTRSDMGLTST
jgi:hypothetical protein